MMMKRRRRPVQVIDLETGEDWYEVPVGRGLVARLGANLGQWLRSPLNHQQRDRS